MKKSQEVRAMNKFPQYDLEYISGRMSLRSPQKESLKILDNILNNIKLSKNIDIEEAKIKINSLYPIFSDILYLLLLYWQQEQGKLG